MSNHFAPRRHLVLWIALVVIVLAGVFLRFGGITNIGLQGSDNTYYTNIAQHWAEGERVYCIGENWPLFRPVVYQVFGAALSVFGFNDASIKMVNAGFDAFNIGLVFFLAFLLSRRNPWVATATAAVYAFLPFTILISRSEQTHILSTTAVLTASVLFAAAWSEENRLRYFLLLALSGMVCGLAALTHEDLIFIAAGPALLLVFSFRLRSEGPWKRLLLPIAGLATYLTIVTLTSLPMLLVHRADARQRSSEITEYRLAQSQYLDLVERPLKYGWNAINGTGSAVLACLVVLVMLILLTRFGCRLVKGRSRWKEAHPQIEDLPLWTVAGYLLLFSSFFGYFAARLFIPLIPLVIIWLMVRSTGLAERLGGRRWIPTTALGLSALLIVTNLGHLAAIRTFEFSHFQTWTPMSLSTDLNPGPGWAEFQRRLTTPTWARQRYEELGHAVDSKARLLVGASTFHPFPGRRTLQMGYYFGDDAVYLFDHDEPVEQLIAEKDIKFALFTSHLAYDQRAVDWMEQQRYRYDGTWEPPSLMTIGAALGFAPGEYTIEAEFERLRSVLESRGSRIILGRGELLKAHPTNFTTPSFIVWALDPAAWPPLEAERKAVLSGLELASTGRLHNALRTLFDAEDNAPPLTRFKLRLTAIRILAEDGLPDKARRRLGNALGLFPRDTTLCTALREAFPSPAETREMYALITTLLPTAPEDPNTRDLLVGLAVNLARFAIETNDHTESVEYFRAIKGLLLAPGPRRFTRATAYWCVVQAQNLSRNGHADEARAALDAASSAYRALLSSGNLADPSLYLEAGRAFSDLGRYPEAIEALSKSRDIDPSNPATWSNLCLTFSRAGEAAQALEVCGKSLALSPEDVSAATAMAPILVRAGRLTEASTLILDLLDRSVGRLSDGEDVEHVRRSAEDVIEHLLTGDAMDLASRVAGALGRFLSDRSRHEPAIDALLRATSLTPENDNLWANLCLAYQRAGQGNAALGSCRTALTINHDHFWARMMSAELFGAAGNWTEALTQAHLASASPPPTGDHLQTFVRLAHQAADAGQDTAACTLLLTVARPESDAVNKTLTELDCTDHMTHHQ